MLFQIIFIVDVYILKHFGLAQVTATTTTFAYSDYTTLDSKTTSNVNSPGTASNKIYTWTKNDGAFSAKGKALSDHVFLKFSNKQDISQCALECLRYDLCESLNYEHTTGLCELNNESHTTSQGNMVVYPTKDYYIKNAFSIDKTALGVCYGNICNSHGRCLEIRTATEGLAPFCVCDPGWRGTFCSVLDPGPQWSQWSDWSVCSVTCSQGWQRRQRYCRKEATQQSVNPSLCSGVTQQYQTCQLQDCPRWTIWGDWQDCSTAVTCGPGIKARRRSCSNGGTVGVDRYCLGLGKETTICQSVDCFGPVRLINGSSPNEGRVELYDGINKQWTMICADHMTDYIATLVCKQAGYPGAYIAIKDARFGVGNGNFGLNNIQCTGNERSLPLCAHNAWTINAKCSDGSSIPGGVQCNVNGVWSLWTTWSDCSVTCENGVRTRTRLCDQPKVMYNGSPCPGSSMEQTSCSLGTCPVDGVWSIWGPWSYCSTSCGDGTQSRIRDCLGPLHGGKNCSGDWTESVACKDKNCPIDGQWEDWSAWLDCSQTCGGGSRSRSRICNGPFFDGQPCIGSSNDVTQCQLQNCPVDGEWLSWNAWTQCSVSCGSGLQIRRRQCKQPLYGGVQCQGQGNENQACNQQFCPIDGTWNTWSLWSDCSASCGQGLHSRNRTCNGPLYGGNICFGANNESESCNLKNCPVDGQWMEWQSWSICSVTCGGGKKYRSRECYLGLYGGSNCTGAFSEESVCNVSPCPVDGVWLPWSAWGQCSLTCGNGTRSRSRSCNGPLNGGANCTGTTQEQQPCYLRSCAVDGVWAAWSEWNSCSLTCGGGLQYKQRECIGPFYGGKICNGNNIDSQSCNSLNCPEDGILSPWSSWEDCSVTCGGGVKERHRICIGPFYGGQDCVDTLVEKGMCNTWDCPVDGVLSSWTVWSECSATCMGSHSRSRTCIGPFNGGLDCQGLFFESQPCNNISCPVDGSWSLWSDWDQCSLTCGDGSQSRSRQCAGTLYGGKMCEGSSEDTRLCNSQHCPVNGVFSDWSPWSTCSLTCGSGRQIRTRTCIGPFYGGLNCSENFDDVQSCNDQHCPVDGYFLVWSAWSECSVTCGGGVQSRERTCFQPLYGGESCKGNLSDSQACNNNPCPVNGYYSPWSDWSPCTVSCGGGTYWRNRTCIPPQFGGLDCTEPSNVTETCNAQPCPIDGYWLTWTGWSSCSTTCGGGQQQRTRMCHEPLYGGLTCQGLGTEYFRCSENPCPIPGLWLPWSPWTPCSATCGGGLHSRVRVCNTTSFGNLTAPCPGSAQETASCHTFNCLPFAKTCTELAKRGLVESTMAEIDPDGSATNSLESIIVYCDLVSYNGTGVTVIGHNQEERTEVQGWEGACEYEADLVYNVSFEHAVSIVEASSNCEQYIKWECYAALIHNYNDNNKITTGWRNRTKGVADYFGDAPPGSNNCTCGAKHECANPSFGCNCDSNDQVWRVDDGYLTYKDDLPVYAFVAGDTGGQDEDGYSQVGPLRCYGISKTNALLESSSST